MDRHLHFTVHEFSEIETDTMIRPLQIGGGDKCVQQSRNQDTQPFTAHRNSEQ